MTDVEPGVPEFSSSGRSGRRNALPDIRGSSDTPGSSELSNELASSLTLSQDDPTKAGGKQPGNKNTENESPEIKKKEAHKQNLVPVSPDDKYKLIPEHILQVD
ncbi:cAMP-dependent protein kinase inhibitor beta [Gracilinanus agilis]|uniref:cAMP-dependent protein kinase inhibitor beta n=1 Tax=Gracilinanus agilis TaxID=191870 RepID=UPI001CFC95B3|nr:cAMP-dependent protein kinase inhibitor beta [Gracilinanus agilis]XP_044532825.1 cAMP-dependent protein kinase inhibitor beta [Gracilinanus agilis]